MRRTTHGFATRISATLTGIVTLALLAGCGGGGGGGGSGGASTTAPAPTVQMSIAPAKLKLGESAQLTWSSTGATECVASDGWAGGQATSGSFTVTPSAAGRQTYSLTCKGAGGTSSASAVSVIPLPVQASSYLNAKNLEVAPQVIPTVEPGTSLSLDRAAALADFFQNGRLSMVGFANYGDVHDGYDYNTKPGKVFFFEKNSEGAWVDKTSSLLSDTTGCVLARKLVVADFNGDGRPDVFASCGGMDAPPFPGEQPRYLLSQPDGSYKNVLADFACYCHSASAAEMTRPGYADILVSQTNIEKTPVFLMNNGDGTFTKDTTRFPSYILDGDRGTGWGINTVELIDFEGRGLYDVFLGSKEPYPGTTWFGLLPTTILPNDGANSFVNATPTTLASNPQCRSVGDVIYKGGFLYVLQVDSFDQPTCPGAIVRKVNLSTLAESTIFTQTVTPADPYVIPWFQPYAGKLVPFDAAYKMSVDQ